MISEIKVTNSAGCSVIDIEGVIGVPEQAQFDDPGGRVATYAKFADAIKRITAIDSEKVVVNIRSTGGSVHDALLIYDALRGLSPAHITTRCMGYTASAATVIAQAASEGAREIARNSLYLIHCSESAAEGNSQSLSAAKELLDKTDDRLANIYAERGAKDAGYYMELMGENGGKGRWLTAEETVEAGLADRIVTGGEVSNNMEQTPTDCLLALLGLPPLSACANQSQQPRTTENENILYTLLNLFKRALSGNQAGKKPAKKTIGKPSGKKRLPTKRPGESAKQSLEIPVNNTKMDAVFFGSWCLSLANAKPTLTAETEDPSVTGDENRQTDPNTLAYREDAMSIRKR